MTRSLCLLAGLASLPMAAAPVKEAPVQEQCRVHKPTAVITATAGPNGCVFPFGVVPAPQGSARTFHFFAEPGYAVEDVLVDGVSVGIRDSYTFEQLAGSHQLQVKFARPLWREEFKGHELDLSKWAFDIGTGANYDGWGNGEWEYYTSSRDNASVEDGQLVITAKREDFGGKPFTSARLVTRGKYSFNHGRIAARIKMPAGNMIWPAFWLLGDSGETWPRCGELDIAEMFCGSVGRGDNAVFATGHWWNDSTNSYANYGLTYTAKAPLSEDFHVYELVWDNNLVHGKIDGQEYWVMDITGPDLSELRSNAFYLILNLAIGQPQWAMHSADQVDGPMPQQMLVDWVRVYQTEDGSAKVVDKAAQQPKGNLGVFADGTTCADTLKLGTDANLYLWNNLSATTGTPQAGETELALKTNSADWFGFGFAATTRRNLANCASGYLNFSLKTTSTDNFKVGLAGGAKGETWVPFNAGVDGYGVVRDGQWHQVSIPMNLFGSTDFTDIQQFFMFASNGAVTPGQAWEFDEIYWSPNAPENQVKPKGQRFGIYTDRACDAGSFNPATDGGIYVWNWGNFQAQAGTPFEGANAYAFTIPSNSWWGLGFTPTKTYDLSAFAHGYLHVALKVPATSTAPFRIGLKSAGGPSIRESWIKFENGADPYGMVRDGAYHELRIPAKDFRNSDLGSLAQLLMVAGDNVADITFDDVYWSAR